MNILDLVCCVILVLWTLLGVYWGFLRQLLALVGVIAAISIAGRTYDLVAGLLGELLPTAPGILSVVAFLLVFSVISCFVSLLATALRRYAGLLFLGRLDHILGGILGFVQGGLVVAMLFIVLTAFPAVGISELVAGSRLAAAWSKPVLWTLPLLPERFYLPNSLMFGATSESP